jgi:8-hydroxy-5-deazaflavin:NADPH oxidoreductase
MRIAVLGTGIAGRTLGSAFERLGHDVVIGTRDPAATRARGDWEPGLPLLAFGDVADAADLVVNATNGQGSVAAVKAVGAETLAGRVLLDVAQHGQLRGDGRSGKGG